LCTENRNDENGNDYGFFRVFSSVLAGIGLRKTAIDLRIDDAPIDIRIGHISKKMYEFKQLHEKFKSYTNYIWSRDCVFGIATGYGLDDREVGVRVPVGSRIFSSSSRPDQLWVHRKYPMGFSPGR
jgi:hypothetical protein